MAPTALQRLQAHIHRMQLALIMKQTQQTQPPRPPGYRLRAARSSHISRRSAHQNVTWESSLSFSLPETDEHAAFFQLVLKRICCETNACQAPSPRRGHTTNLLFLQTMKQVHRFLQFLVHWQALAVSAGGQTHRPVQHSHA
jgi:hypothetical protein